MPRSLLALALLLAACTPAPVTFTPIAPSATVMEPTYTATATETRTPMATDTAQPTPTRYPTATAYPSYTPQPTPTRYPVQPSYTPYPTYTQPPTFTPTPTATMRSADGRQVRPRLIPHFSANYPEAVCWARWFYSVTEGRTTWIHDNPREYALCVATMGAAGVRYAAPA